MIALFIEKFKSDNGFCNGLTLLYQYSRWLQIPDRFNNIIKTISSWNGTDNLKDADIQDILFFIKKITFLQNPMRYYNEPISQLNLNKFIASSSLAIRGEELKREYSIVSSFTLENLRNFLKNMLHEGRLVNVCY